MFVFQSLGEEEEGLFIRFKVESGEFKGTGFRAYEVHPCTDVTCSCGNIYFTTEDNEEYGLDTELHRILKYTDEQTLTSADDPFLLALENEMTAEQWEEAEEYIVNLKGLASEIIDPHKFEAEFLDYKNLMGGYQLAAYFDVLPWAIDLTIEVDGETYFFVDLYCVKPTCDCTNILLCLSKDLGEEPELEIWFDYKNKEVEIADINTKKLPAARIIREFKYDQFEQYQGILRNRHQRMRTFFKDFIHREGITPTIQMPLTKQVTIGRNDPCPCGSGKKYKKCCGV